MNTESRHDLNFHRDPILRITEKDLVLHRRAIDRLRAHLFRKYRPADFFVVASSEVVLPPSAYYDIRAGGTPAPRALHLGGLRYEVSSLQQGSWYEAEIKHWILDTFELALIVHAGKSVYTRFVLTKRFEKIDSTLYRCIHSARVVDAPRPK